MWKCCLPTRRRDMGGGKSDTQKEIKLLWENQPSLIWFLLTFHKWWMCRRLINSEVFFEAFCLRVTEEQQGNETKLVTNIVRAGHRGHNHSMVWKRLGWWITADLTLRGSFNLHSLKLQLSIKAISYQPGLTGYDRGVEGMRGAAERLFLSHI